MRLIIIFYASTIIILIIKGDPGPAGGIGPKGEKGGKVELLGGCSDSVLKAS